MMNGIHFRLAVWSAVLCAALAPAPGRAEDAAARDLVQKVRDTAPKTPFAAKAKLTGDRGLIRELDLKHKYLNDAEATRRTISKDGFLYTGDLGWVDDTGVHFAGRSKFVIKPRGYQVFPGEVENFIAHAFKRVSMTLEMPFKDHNYLPDRRQGWSPERCIVPTCTTRLYLRAASTMMRPSSTVTEMGFST